MEPQFESASGLIGVLVASESRSESRRSDSESSWMLPQWLLCSESPVSHAPNAAASTRVPLAMSVPQRTRGTGTVTSHLPVTPTPAGDHEQDAKLPLFQATSNAAAHWPD